MCSSQANISILWSTVQRRKHLSWISSAHPSRTPSPSLGSQNISFCGTSGCFVAHILRTTAVIEQSFIRIVYRRIFLSVSSSNPSAFLHYHCPISWWSFSCDDGFSFLSLVLQLRSSSELDQDILNDCLTIQPLQPAPSPHDAADNTMGRSPGPVHDIYTGIVKRQEMIPEHLKLGMTDVYFWDF